MSLPELALLGLMSGGFFAALWLMYRHFHPRTTTRERMERAAKRADLNSPPTANPAPSQTGGSGATSTNQPRGRWLNRSAVPQFIQRIPFLGTTLLDADFDLRADLAGMRHRLLIRQIKFDRQRWEREGEALDPNANIYFRVPMRWWILNIFGLGSDISWYVLFQDFYFNITGNKIEANQRVLNQQGEQFFDTNITAITNKVAGDTPGWLLERLGVKTIVITVFAKPHRIPVLAAGLRWPDNFRDLDGAWVGGEKAVIRILEYIDARVKNGGPFTDHLVNPTPPTASAPQVAVPTPSAPQPTSQPATLPPPPGPSVATSSYTAASSARPDPDVWLERRFG